MSEALLRLAGFLIRWSLIPLLFLSPLLLVALILIRLKKRHQNTSDEPFTDLPLRPPGESLRGKIEQKTEVFEGYLVAMFLTGTLCSGLVIGDSRQLPWASVLTAAVYLYSGVKMWKVAKEL